MNEKLKEIIDSATVDGAKEVYDGYNNYQEALRVAKEEYEENCRKIAEQYKEELKLYMLVENVKKSIESKLNPKGDN